MLLCFITSLSNLGAAGTYINILQLLNEPYETQLFKVN